MKCCRSVMPKNRRRRFFHFRKIRNEAVISAKSAMEKSELDVTVLILLSAALAVRAVVLFRRDIPLQKASSGT